MSDEAHIGQGVKPDTLAQAKQRIFSSDEKLFCVIKGVAHRIDPRLRRAVHTRTSGLLLITSKRIVFYSEGMFSRFDQLVFPYDQVSSVQCHKGMIGDELQLQVASDNVQIHAIPKGDGDIAAQNIRDLVATMKTQPSMAVAASVAAPETDILAQIEKLGKLKEKGLITDEEFDRKKNELLKRL